MPKAVDKHPQARGLGNALWSPRRSGVSSYEDPYSAIDDTARQAGGGLRGLIDGVGDGVVDKVLELTGLDISGPVALLEQLLAVPLAFVGSSPLSHIVDILGQFLPFLPGGDPDTFDPNAAAASWIASRLLPAGLLIGPDSPLNALNLFGQIQPHLFNLVPLSAITNRNENVLWNGKFTGAISISGGSGWEWDGTVYRSVDDDEPGSAKVTADGGLKAMRSNKIAVAAGKTINVEGHALTSSDFTSTGTPIQIALTLYSGAVIVGEQLIDAAAEPSGGNTWAAAPAGANEVDLSGSYDVPEADVGDPQIDAVAARLVLDATASAGDLWFDDCKATLGGNIAQDWIEGLPVALQDAIDRWQALVDEVVNGILDAERFGNLLEDVRDALRNIPHPNVVGIGGPIHIGASVQETWDQWIGGLVGTVGTGAGLSDLFNIGQLVSSWASKGRDSWDILGIRSNKSLNAGLLATSESNMGLDKVALQASAPTFALTQSTAITGFQRISESALKGVVSWLGSGVTNVTHAFVNIFKMDPSTGAMTLVHASANIVGSLSASMQYNLYELPDPIQVEPGEVYGIELAIRGAGTHSVVGQSTWLPDHPSVFPRRLSAVRNSGTTAPPSTIAPGSVAYTSNVPFIEFGVSAGDVDIARTSSPTLFNNAGTSSIPVPSWANNVDIIALGGGGGGRQGGTWGVSGEGADAGVWATTTWVRGVDFSGSPSISVTVGAGGAGGTGVGDSGGNTVVTLPATSGFGSDSVTATGGEGGDALNALGSDRDGQSPGNQTYDGITYVGGVAQVVAGGNGAKPGGGGAGGNGVSFQHGGDGAPGVVWIVARP